LEPWGKAQGNSNGISGWGREPTPANERLVEVLRIERNAISTNKKR
jgi:hypothetical protein